MRISGIELVKFRRFASLVIKDIPQTARLVVLAGPNGSGKTSLFDALLVIHRKLIGFGDSGDLKYYNRSDSTYAVPSQGVVVKTHGDQLTQPGALYVRSAHRHVPEFSSTSLSQKPAILENMQLNKLIDSDRTVADNYAHIASKAVQGIFTKEANATTIGAFRQNIIGPIHEPLNRLFPDLNFVGIGNPLEKGTFQFEKGSTEKFDYQNLSGGEKAAFDLILDLVVKRESYADAVYCIDEPETHMNTRIHGALLQELLDLLPGQSQIWIASHSIGMMRKAMELYDTDPGSVVFLDFSGHNFDEATIITPQKPTHAFWQSILRIALDDLATLVAPRQVVLCEGSPVRPVPGKNVEHDARVYSTIFADEMPDVTFISAGSAKQVSGDFLALAAALPRVAAGMTVRRLIDLDDHAPNDVVLHERNGLTLLSRRNLESYLFDDEILRSLCESVGKTEAVAAVLEAKQQAISESIMRGNPSDDIKSASAKIYTETKRILGLTQSGNDHLAFARNMLAPLVTSGTEVYALLKRDIFDK